MQILYTGVYLHDPTTVVAAINPSLLTYTEGVVRVQTCGITRGLTLFDNTKKRSLFYTALFVFFFFSFLLFLQLDSSEVSQQKLPQKFVHHLGCLAV
jgi:inosine-uridine nucleoside N-ribohydrolase